MVFAERLNQAYQTCLDAGQRIGRQVVRTLRRAEGWELAAYLGVGLVALALILPAALALVVAGLVVAFVLAWVHEFVFLMRLAPDAFPGRNDRAVWMALMILLPPVGLLTFWSFRRAAWPETKAKANEVEDWV